MERYIDQSLAYLTLKRESEKYGMSFTAEAFEKAARIIDQMPSADVEPVRQGHWITDTAFGADVMSGGSMVLCSKCGKGVFHHTLYCPHCGAKMDGGDEDA